jgi:hypothetical protein
MTFISKAILLMLSWAASAIAASTPAPQSVTGAYNVYMNGAHVAVMKESFEAKDQTYRIVSESTPIGVVALVKKPAMVVSSGQVAPEGLRPQRFEGRLVAGGEVKAEFDWSGGRLAFTHGGKTETVELPAGTQDRLSVMYQFMFYPYDKRERLDFHMTDGRRLASYRYTVTPNVQIDTPMGRITTLHLVKQTEPADGSGTEIWIAPQHHFLPVKMLIREHNGTRYEQVATRIDVKTTVAARR